MSYLSNIKNLLTGETNITIADYSDETSNICCITPYAGKAKHTFDSVIRNPSVQIMLRDESAFNLHTRAENVINAIKRYEDSTMAIFLDDDIVTGIKDEKMRSIVYINFSVIIK